MMRRHCLERRKTVERLEPLFATVAGFPGAAKGQFHASARIVIVDKYLPRPQRPRQPHLAHAVTRQDAGDKTVFGAVGDQSRSVLSAAPEPTTLMP